MTSAPIPSDENERLKALQRYQMLDTPFEKAFDEITKLASFICEAPISLITLIDEERVWHKSMVGMAEPEIPRDFSFCPHAIQQDDVL
jgi:hypothetical protein